MAERLRLEVVTPQRSVLDLEVEEVALPGVLGELGVLPEHTPLLTALGVGRLTYRARDGAGVLVVGGGFAEILPDKVTVLADVAEAPDEVDVDAATAQKAEAEGAMKEASAEDVEALAADLRLNEVRLEIAKR